jgi:hypothetical protein
VAEVKCRDAMGPAEIVDLVPVEEIGPLIWGVAVAVPEAMTVPDEVFEPGRFLWPVGKVRYWGKRTFALSTGNGRP